MAVHRKDTTEAEAGEIVQNSLHRTQQSFRVGFSAWTGTLRRSFGTSCSQANEDALEPFAAVEKKIVGRSNGKFDGITAGKSLNMSNALLPLLNTAQI
jgi:hypothetical protein